MTTTIEYQNQAELIRKLIATLEGVGVNVPPIRWLTPKEVAERFNMKPSALSMALKRYEMDFPKITGESGRIIGMIVTPSLREHLTK